VYLMSIPISWAIALAVAAAMSVVLLVGLAARRGIVAAPERALVQVAYLLGGGVAGFVALAFYPAWPVLAAVVGMLVIRAVQTRRSLDIGLLMVGFGSTWTLLRGLAILNDMTDPAVTSTGEEGGGFVLAALILLAGLWVTIAASFRRGRSGSWRR
jgi:hypothetical protein